MNGAHRMTQKGAIPFDEAAVVNLTVCVPGGPRGKRTDAVWLAPRPRRRRCWSSPGSTTTRSARAIPTCGAQPQVGDPRPRAAVARGAAADRAWQMARSSAGTGCTRSTWTGRSRGALQELTDMGESGPHGPDRRPRGGLEDAGRKYGAPDFSEAHLLPRRRGRQIQAGALVQPGGVRQLRRRSTSCTRTATSRSTTS